MQLHGYRGMHRTETRQDRSQNEVGEPVDARHDDAAPKTRIVSLDLTLQREHRLFDALEIRTHAFAERRRMQTLRMALEQPDAEATLECIEPAAHRRLCDLKRARRGAQ